MNNVIFRQDHKGYTLLLKAVICDNRIIPHPTETTIFILDNCYFYYDLCFVEDNGPAQVTINDKEYIIESPLWEEIFMVVGPYSAMEIECHLLKNGEWVPNPNVKNQ